jgi:hypothetical protein
MNDTHPFADPIVREAWDKFREAVHAALERECVALLREARPAEPMPIFCEHDTTCWQSSDGTAWIQCSRCASSARSHPGSPGFPVLPLHVIGYTMPAAPHGTTMDVIDGGTQ